jgi:hypothetical protein
MAALGEPWGEVLQSWEFGLDSDNRISEYGALVTQPWASRVSGVVVTHVHGYVQWFPNPFADPDLRDPRLIRLGLPLDVSWSEHSAWHRYP